MRFLRVAGGAENKQADARYKRLQHTRIGRTTRPLPSPICRDGMAERCLPDSHGHSCKAIDALHTPMDNVAHAHGQRCTRPWTTLHTAVDNASSGIMKRECLGAERKLGKPFCELQKEDHAAAMAAWSSLFEMKRWSEPACAARSAA